MTVDDQIKDLQGLVQELGDNCAKLSAENEKLKQSQLSLIFDLSQIAMALNVKQTTADVLEAVRVLVNNQVREQVVYVPMMRTLDTHEQRKYRVYFSDSKAAQQLQNDRRPFDIDDSRYEWYGISSESHFVYKGKFVDLKEPYKVYASYDEYMREHLDKILTPDEKKLLK